MSDSHTQHIDQVITSRHSVRAFLDHPVAIETIKDILAVASRAPSGTNTQPWKVYVATGHTRQRVIDQVCQVQQQIFKNPEIAKQYTESFDYYPKKWISPFIERRRENGWGLYGLLNIQRHEKDKMQAQLLRNYQLFDAPVALFFTIHHSLGIGAKMDISMMIQNVMLAAKARGLDTCPQAAWNHFHSIVMDILGAPEDEELVCTIALGYADPDARVNQFLTPRIAVDAFAVFVD